MNEIKFDISGNNSDIIKKTKEIRRAISSISEPMNGQGFNLEMAFNEVSVKALEQIGGILKKLPSEVKGLNHVSKEIEYLDKSLKQLIKNLVEVQGKVKQITPIQSYQEKNKEEILASELLIKCIKDTLVLREQNISLIYQEQDAISLNQKELESLENLENDGLELSEAQMEKRILLMEGLIEHKRAIETLNLAITSEIQIERVVITSIAEMVQSLNHVQSVYSQLSEQERSSKFGRELSISIQDADELVKRFMATLEDTRSSMDDYTYRWSRLQQQIQLAARELPSAGTSFSTFCTSIKENLPYLIEEFNKAKRAYSEYQMAMNSGQANIPKVASVGTQMIKSLLSWQTVIIVGVTLLAAYSKEIGEWISGLFRAKDASKNLLSVEQEMALARKTAVENSIQERVELDLLYRTAINVGKIDTERYTAVSKLQSLYPQIFENYSREEIMLGRAASGYENLKEQIIATAKAKAYENKIAEIEEKRWQNEIKRLNQKKHFLR